MNNRLMVSVAAIALIAGAGYANAQGTGASRESGGAAMHSAPAGGAAAGGAQTGGAMEKSESAAPAAGPSSEPKSSQSEQKSPAAAKNQRADDNIQGQKSKGMSSENETKGGPKDMKAEGANKSEGANSNMKAEGHDKTNGNIKAEGRDNANGNVKAEGKTGTERSQVTTGQAGAAAKLSTEQRTKISTVIRSQRVAPVTNVNFSISIGTRVPRDIEYRPLPTEVVTIYPEWRGYDFVLVRDQIIVIDPQTFEIVAVLDT